MIRIGSPKVRSASPRVRLHAESTADPRVVRWVVPAECVRSVGRVICDDADADVPAAVLQALATGDLTRVCLTATSMECEIADPSRWLHLAPLINEALFTYLTSGHVLACQRSDADDAALANAVAELVAGDVTDYATSHGGTISLVDVRNGVVTLRLSGACRGCPAAQSTITAGIAAKLNPNLPPVAGFRVTD